MIVKDITNHLETIAPLSLQESYDNAGLIVGDQNQTVKTCLVCLDCTEEIIDEAIAKNAELVVAHHPIVFSGLKKITGQNYIERTLIKAIKNNIAIYAIHTNLDNVHNGVNQEIGKRLNLKNLKVLMPKNGEIKKLVTFVPHTYLEKVSQALFTAGAGSIGNYSNCSFVAEGTGSFKANAGAHPFTGEVGVQHFEKESRLEVIVNNFALSSVLNALKTAHPYEEVAYDIYALENAQPQIGAGMIGELEQASAEIDFLKTVKQNLNTKCIRHTALLNKPVVKVAFCGGSGSFLLDAAKKAGAQVFITGDFKYHQFFDADQELVIFDVGHFESEQFTIDLLSDILNKKFSTIAVLKTEVNTNPISYF